MSVVRGPGRGPRRSFTKTLGGIPTGPILTSITPNADRTAGGTSVTITGRNFRNNSDGSAPTVMFGANPGTNVVVVDQFTITVDVPASLITGSVNVSVTIDGQIGTLVNGFSYYAGFISSLSPNHGPFSGGTEVSIKGFNFVTGSTVTFGGVPATNVVFIDEENIVVTTPAHATGYVDVVITEPSASTVELRNGFKYTLLNRGEDIRRNPSIVIRDVLNNAPNSCTFTIDGDSFPPLEGEEIEITDPFDGDRLLFAGNVQMVEQIYEGQRHQLAWKVTCIDFTWSLNRLRPFGVYDNVSASDIVNDLVNRFAPGFTTNFVQTRLAPLSVNFDGTRDFSTCLSDLSAALGGGHWYVDYDRDVHFFHVPPPDLTPSIPISNGPGSAVTLSEDGLIESVNGFPIGYYFVRVTFLYSNGVESKLGPMSNVVAFLGNKYMQLDDIPIGVDPGGGITVVARRIYLQRGTNGLQRAWRIDDNVTTSITTYPAAPNTGTVIWEGGVNTPITVIPPTIDTPAFFDITAPVVTNTGGQRMTFPGTSQTFYFQQGQYRFSVSAIYADGSESLPSPPSNIIQLGGGGGGSTAGIGPNFISLPLFPTVNGVIPTAYRIFTDLVLATNAGAPGGIIISDGPLELGIIPYPQSGVQPVGGTPIITAEPNFGERPKGPSQGLRLTWPNDDGPFLETFDPPGDIDDDNMDLLRDPQVTVTRDLSQVRNKVTVLGAGTALTADAAINDTELAVADTSIFSEVGGLLVIEGQVVTYFAPSASEGPGSIFLTEGLTKAVQNGAGIRHYMQVENRDSQVALGKIELDVNGNPTSGIHESVISDPTLTIPQQLYLAGNAELELFSRPIVTVRYATRDPNTRSGRKVTFNLTDPPVTGEFLIQDVTIDQVHDESDQVSPRYSATASSVKFELTDLLLQIARAAAGQGGSVVVGLNGVASGSSSEGSAGDVHPQGVISAAPGSTYRRPNGYVYTKFGGGSTEWGWYQNIDRTNYGKQPSVFGWEVTELTGIADTGGPLKQGAWANTNANNAAIVFLSDLMPYRRTETNGVSQVTGISSNTAPNIIFWEQDYDLVMRIAIESKRNIYYFCGLSDASITDNFNVVADAAPDCFQMFAYRHTVAAQFNEGGWVGINKSAASQISTTAVVPGGSMAPGVSGIDLFTLRIRKTKRVNPDTGSDVPVPVLLYSVNDGVEIAVFSRVTSTNAAGNPFLTIGAVNKDAALAANARIYVRSITVNVGPQ